MTRKPAAASGSIWRRHPLQNSGKPWRRTTTGPCCGPATTACNATSPFLKDSLSKERQYYPKESEARSAGSRGTHFGSVDAEAQPREVRLAQGHRAGVQIAPNKEQQEWNSGVVFVGDGVHDGEREIQAKQHFRVRHPAGFVLVRFFCEGALLAFDPEFRRAGKFAFLAEQRFDHRLRVANGNADARGHHEWQVEKSSLPRFRA